MRNQEFVFAHGAAEKFLVLNARDAPERRQASFFNPAAGTNVSTPRSTKLERRLRAVATASRSASISDTFSLASTRRCFMSVRRASMLFATSRAAFLMWSRVDIVGSHHIERAP